MNWSKVKNILLGMLIAMNVFLGGELIYKRISTETIPPVVWSAATLALENSGITCDSSLIPKKYLTAPGLNAKFLSPMELSKIFFGSQLAFQTDGSTLTAVGDGASLTVDGESFSYSTGKKETEASEKELRRALEKAGIEMRGGKYSSEYGIFLLYYDKRPLFGMYIRAALDENGNLCRAEGRWPEITSVSAAETGLSVISRFPALGNELTGGGEIESIRFGYDITKDVVSENYVFVPAWQVKMTDGRKAVLR